MANNDWITSYHPSKIDLLDTIDTQIQTIDVYLTDLNTNTIPTLEEMTTNLNNINNIVSTEQNTIIQNDINNIKQRKAFVTTWDINNNNPVFNTEKTFSENSICFIVTDN